MSACPFDTTDASRADSPDTCPAGSAVATITAYPDGPFLVRGDFELRDADGSVTSVERRTVALCRCGRSSIKPLCDGTHKAGPAGRRHT